MTSAATMRVPVIARGLGVVAMDPAAHPVHELGVGIGEVDLARRDRRRLARIRRTAEAPAVLHAPARSVGRVLRVGVTLDGEFLLQAPLALAQPRRPRPRNRRRLRGAPPLRSLAGIAQPALPTLMRREDLGQLVAAPIAQVGGLCGISGNRLFDDRAGDLLVIHRPIPAGVGVHLRAVDRDHSDRGENGVRAQRQPAGQQRLCATASGMSDSALTTAGASATRAKR